MIVCGFCGSGTGLCGRSMPCIRAVRQWEVRPTVTVRRVRHSKTLMWQRVSGLARACQRGVGYTVNYNDQDREEQEIVCLEPMGSERMEMRKRQMSVQQEAAPAGQAQTGPSPRASNACCFCWCCCCSCSCLTVRNEDETIQRFEVKTDTTNNCEESPKPTLEEARSWSVSFEKLMKSASGRCCFRQYLRTEFSEENMMFWLTCEELKKETNKTVVEEKVRHIYEDFISILSPKEVSLDSHVRDVINRNMLEPTSHTFDDAQNQIYTLMQRDSYPRFINSTEYTDLLKSLQEMPPEP